MIAILMKINIISTIDRPDPKFQLFATLNSWSMTFPKRSTIEPPKISATTNSDILGIYTIIIPLIIPGRDNGIIIF